MMAPWLMTRTPDVLAALRIDEDEENERVRKLQARPALAELPTGDFELWEALQEELPRPARPETPPPAERIINPYFSEYTQEFGPATQPVALYSVDALANWALARRAR